MDARGDGATRRVPTIYLNLWNGGVIDRPTASRGKQEIFKYSTSVTTHQGCSEAQVQWPMWWEPYLQHYRITQDQTTRVLPFLQLKSTPGTLELSTIDSPKARDRRARSVVRDPVLTPMLNSIDWAVRRRN